MIHLVLANSHIPLVEDFRTTRPWVVKSHPDRDPRNEVSCIATAQRISLSEVGGLKPKVPRPGIQAQHPAPAPHARHDRSMARNRLAARPNSAVWATHPPDPRPETMGVYGESMCSNSSGKPLVFFRLRIRYVRGTLKA